MATTRLYYRTRFQIEFCFRDAKGYTGLMDCQARDKWKLDFAFNDSFTSLNVAKVTMKEMGMEYSMSSFKRSTGVPDWIQHIR